MSKPGTPQFHSQVAVITGGSRGIGAAIASKLAEFGMTVAITARRKDSLEQTRAAINSAGAHCEAVECDVTRLADVEALCATVKDRFGRCDVLVNNAGIGAFRKPLHELPPEEWENVMNTNLRAAYYTIRAFTPMMIAAKSGHIINISSIAGKNALANAAVYCASKWGLNGLTYSVAEELRGHNIRVSVIAPGSTDTNMLAKASGDHNRMLRPEDIAHAVGMIVSQAPQSFVSEIIVRPTQKP